jgi:predicted metal-dependent phosphoesterase TrpH
MDGSNYLDLVEIGKVNESFDFVYVPGENITTVWHEHGNKLLGTHRHND